MEMLSKTKDALGGLWLSFDAQERIIALYVCLFGALMIAGLRAESKRKREMAEWKRDIIDGVAEAIRG